MKLKKSKYNIEIDKVNDGEILLYNTMSTSLVSMDIENQNIYNDIENSEYHDVGENTDAVDMMIRNGFLVNKDIDEGKYLKTLRNELIYNPGFMTLTIAPTMDCNMKCPYCFEKKDTSVMKDTTQDKIIDFIKKNIAKSKIKSLHVTWYGGEPLLERDIICKLSKKIISLCRDSNIKYTSNIITNGSLIDYKTAKILVDECNVEFAQITIDGVRDTNNKRRILKNGEDSFAIITKNIKECQKIMPINIRVNIDKTNLNEIDEIMELYFNDLKISDNVDINFAPVVDSNIENQTCGNNYLTNKEFAELYMDIMNKVYELRVRKGLDSIKSMVPYPMASVISCNTLSTTCYVIDPNGMLYNCWNDIGNESKKVGSVYEGVFYNAESMKWKTYELPQKCDECELLPMCQGGCPYDRINKGKCDCLKEAETYKPILKLYYKDYIDHLKEVEVTK